MNKQRIKNILTNKQKNKETDKQIKTFTLLKKKTNKQLRETKTELFVLILFLLKYCTFVFTSY